MTKVLVIEDDRALNAGLTFALNKEGYDVTCAWSGKDARQCLKDRFDLIILDVSLPDTSGFKLVAEISGTPLIFLTAQNCEQDVLKGFALGCEDYITKPFSLKILLEKIKVVIRRHQGARTRLYACRNLVYDMSTKDLTIDDQSVGLSKKEHKILNFLITNKGQVVAIDQLLNPIWSTEGDFIDENTVRVHINRLRKKIERDASNPRWIQTIFGLGYKWCEEDENQ